MISIAKKPRSVKRQKRAKGPKARTLQPPRFAIRIDSLDRRYAIDKRTGWRVPLYKAEKERKKRREAIKAIPRYISPKPTKTSKKRSQAAKRGWETRRAQVETRSKAAKRGWETRRKRELPPLPIGAPPTAPVSITLPEGTIEVVPISVLTPPEKLVPPGVRMVPLAYTSVADRMARYPKVKEAAERAFVNLQYEAWGKKKVALEEIPRPKLTREDQIKDNIRDLIAERIQNPEDIDRVLEELWDEFDQEYSMRELYQIYFSPEVA